MNAKLELQISLYQGITLLSNFTIIRSTSLIINQNLEHLLSNKIRTFKFLTKAVKEYKLEGQ
jgi:hypothetical protein